MSLASAQQLIDAALAAGGTDGLVVIVDERTEANIRWAGNSLTTNGEMASRSVTVVATAAVGDGAGAGVVGGPAETTADVVELVARAERAARRSSADSDALPLVGPEAAHAPWAADFDLPPKVATIGEFADISRDLGEVFRASRGDGRAQFGFAEQVTTTTYLGSSTGLRLRYVQPSGRLEMNAKSADWQRSAYVAQAVRDPAEADVLAADAELIRRLDWSRRTVQLPAGRYETILPPSAVADLAINMAVDVQARESDEGRTAFSRKGGGSRVGDRLSAMPITMASDPGYPGLECAPFGIYRESGPGTSVFDNGTPLRRVEWIADGVLAALEGSRGYAAASAHGTPVAQGGSNLALSAEPAFAGGPQPDLEQLVAETRRGLLLTTLWYIRTVDPTNLLLTGLTRDGVFLVEDGEIVAAVNNFRFNESPLLLLERIAVVGSTVRCYPREWGDYFARTAMPPLRVVDFNMSSASQAQ